MAVEAVTPQPWFRFYSDALNDPKVQKLPPPLFKHWVNLLCVASKHEGLIPKPSDLAFEMRLKDAVVESMIRQLESVGLLDRAAETLRPHNWNARQYKSDVSTERVRKHRETVSRNGQEAFHETAPEQSRAETDQKQTRPERVRLDDPVDQIVADFAIFGLLTPGTVMGIE